MAAVSTVIDIHSGPAWVLVGDPTTAAGAGLVDLGLVLNASVKLNLWRQMSRNEYNQIIDDGVYGVVNGASISLQMLTVSATILAAMINEVVDNTTWVGATTDLATRAGFTMVIVPDHAKTAATSLTNLATQWIPLAIATDVGEFIHRLEKAGTDDDTNPYTITFEALYTPADQAGDTLLEGGRIWFKGSPAGPKSSATPAWSLPSGY